MLKILNSLVVAIGVLGYSCSLYAAADEAAVKVKWGYIGNTDPERWGQLDPDFAICARGKTQSPININKKVIKADNQLSIHYQAAPMTILEDGPTHLTIGTNQLVVNTGHSIQLNFPTYHPSEVLTFAGNRYHLIQLHFHSPSEHTWHNQAFPLEVHFVHQNESGGLLVIGVFVKGGEATLAIQKIIEHLPADKGVAHTVQEQINPADLLPVKQDYYAYNGSLTTPPCTEGVQWIVMAEPIMASYVQIAQLRKAAGGVNARPVQPLNKRKVFYAQPS